MKSVRTKRNIIFFENISFSRIAHCLQSSLTNRNEFFSYYSKRLKKHLFFIFIHSIKSIFFSFSIPTLLLDGVKINPLIFLEVKYSRVL